MCSMSEVPPKGENTSLILLLRGFGRVIQLNNDGCCTTIIEHFGLAMSQSEQNLYLGAGCRALKRSGWALLVVGINLCCSWVCVLKAV